MKPARWLWALLAVAMVLAAMSTVWFAGPRIAPSLVIRWIPFADPVARALVEQYGDGFRPYAIDVNPNTPPPIDPFRWSDTLNGLTGDPDTALIRLASDPRPGRAFLALALLAEHRHLALSDIVDKGLKAQGGFPLQSDQALLAAAGPLSPKGTRLLAQRTLIGQGVESALPLIIAELNHSEPDCRRRAATLLISWGNARDLTPWNHSAYGVFPKPAPGTFGAKSAI